MRLLIVGGLQGHLGLATKIAMDKGAKVTHAADIEQALSSLRGGIGADLAFCDVSPIPAPWCAARRPNASALRSSPAASAPHTRRADAIRGRQGISAPPADPN
jgi:hypothetical protein